jgi:hypothetical protein
MANWGNTDDAANSVLWATARVNLTANTGNQANLFGNTTTSATITGAAVGQFGVDTTEMSVSNGSLVMGQVTFAGSGYRANAAVTVSGNGTANATANASGKISAVNVVLAGNNYVSKPTVAIAAPAAQTFNSNTATYNTQAFNANTGVTNATDFIAIASNPFVNGDLLVYTTSTGNTAVTGLTNAASYYAVSANSIGLKLALTSGGANIDITATAISETGHNLKRTMGYITIGTNVLENNDIVVYTVAAGNTALTGLANGTQYWVRDANSSVIRLAATPNGNAIVLVPGVTEAGHSLTGQTATGEITVSGASGKGFHAGWVLRTRGTGGRAGRVQYETLVAMGSMTGDSEDTIFKDA